MIYLRIVFLSFLLIGSQSCKEKEESEPIWTWDNTWQQFEDVDMSPGAITDVILKIPLPPFEYSFRVIAPNSFETGGNPLIFSLHGGVSVAGVDAHKSTACIEPSLRSLNAFIISPNADKFQWYETVNQNKIGDLITGAVKAWNIDENRLVVTGYSDGANGSWFFAEYYSDIFSAAIPVSSSYNSDLDENTGKKFNIPLYVIHSNGDELFPLETTQNWVQRSIDAGSEIEFVVADGLSHYKPCDYMPYLENASTWLQESVWQ